jgi:outer membrane immunogenic protein
MGRFPYAALAAASVFSFASVASAADMPVKAPVAAPVVAYNWTGIFSSTGLGAAWWDVDGKLAVPGLFLVHNSESSRFDLASTIGAQYQWNNVVLGVEAGFNKLYNNNYANTPGATAECLNNPAFIGVTCSSRVNNIWTVGGRLGYAWDRLMVFGTGGYANGHVYSQTTTPTGVIIDQTDARQGGWFAGGGFEYFVTRFWISDLIIGAEYQHIDLGNVFHISSDGNPNDNRNYRATVDIVRARVVFKWTPPGMHAAR